VAKRHPLVLDYPEPKILFQEFGDSSLNFSLRVWTSDFDNWLSISSDITLQLHDALKKAGIEIPFPQRDLNIRTINNQNMDILETAKKRHIKN
jgi:potassium efflux system protein